MSQHCNMPTVYSSISPPSLHTYHSTMGYQPLYQGYFISNTSPSVNRREYSYPSQSVLDNPMASHIKFSNNCKYSSTPKLMSTRYTTSHPHYSGRGLKTILVQIPGSRRVQRFKICVGNDPEDIKAWISERKKQYPILYRNRKRDQSNKNRGITKQNKKLNESENFIKEEFTKRENSLKSLLIYNSSSDEDHDIDKVFTTTFELENVSNSDHSINRHKIEKNYDITKDSNSAEIGQYFYPLEETRGRSVERSDNLKTKLCKYYLSKGSCKYGDNCNFIHDSQKYQKCMERKKSCIKKKNSSYMDSKNILEGQFLRKLLESDIRKEKILTLQLLQYIVSCNFFQN